MVELTQLLYLILITFVPWIEVRGSIPYGLYEGIDPIAVFLICTLTNIALIPIVFFFLDYIFPYIRKWKIADIILRRTEKRTKKYVDRYGFLGLTLFVAIPLPGTGAYTGAIAAYIFSMKRMQAFQAITLGVIIAAVLVTLITTSVLTIPKIL